MFFVPNHAAKFEKILSMNPDIGPQLCQNCPFSPKDYFFKFSL